MLIFESTQHNFCVGDGLLNEMSRSRLHPKCLSWCNLPLVELPQSLSYFIKCLRIFWLLFQADMAGTNTHTHSREWMPKLSPSRAYPAVCGVNLIQWENCLARKTGQFVCARSSTLLCRSLWGHRVTGRWRKPQTGREEKSDTETCCHRILWFLVNI